MKRALVRLLTFCLSLNLSAPVYHSNSPQKEKLAPPTPTKPERFVVQWKGSSIEVVPGSFPLQVRIIEPSGTPMSKTLTEEQQGMVDRLSFGNERIRAVMAMQMAGYIPQEESLRLIRELQMRQFQIPSGGGKTFVATLAGDAAPTEAERRALDEAVKPVIARAVKSKKALRVGKVTPLLSAQTADANLAARTAQAYRLLAEAAVAYAKKNQSTPAAVAIRGSGWYAGTDSDDGRALARVVFLTSTEGPALIAKGNNHLIGSSGRFKKEEALREAPFGSHYVTLALVESAVPALGVEKGMAFLGAWVAHEAQVLKERRYVEPNEEDRKILNEGYRRILLAGKSKPSAYARLNAGDRAYMDSIASSSAVARELLSKIFINEIPEPAAKLELLEFGFDAATVNRWCGILSGDSPVERATLGRGAAAEKAVATSL